MIPSLIKMHLPNIKTLLITNKTVLILTKQMLTHKRSIRLFLKLIYLLNFLILLHPHRRVLPIIIPHKVLISNILFFISIIDKVDFRWVLICKVFQWELIELIVYRNTNVIF